MYTRLTETEWAEKVRETDERKSDFIVPTGKMAVSTADRETDLTITFPDGEKTYRMTPLAHKHLAADLGQPDYNNGFDPKLYERTRTVMPDLFDQVVNRWLAYPTALRHRMVRCLEATPTESAIVRGICSDSYLTLDDRPTMDHLAQAFGDIPDLETVSCDYSAEAMHLKVVSRNPKYRGEIEVGEYVDFGIMLRNSPVRFSALGVEPLIEELRCKNGLIMNVAGDYGLQALERRHSGPKIGKYDYAVPYRSTWRQEEIRQEVWRLARQAIRSMFDSDILARLIAQARAARERPLADPEAAVRHLRAQYNITEEASTVVLNHLLASGENHQWGLTRAVTRAAQDMPSYAATTTFEKLGGELVELSAAQWKAFAEAESGGAAKVTA